MIATSDDHATVVRGWWAVRSGGGRGMTSQGVRSGVHRFAWIDEVGLDRWAFERDALATPVPGGELRDAVA